MVQIRLSPSIKTSLGKKVIFEYFPSIFFLFFYNWYVIYRIFRCILWNESLQLARNEWVWSVDFVFSRIARRSVSFSAKKNRKLNQRCRGSGKSHNRVSRVNHSILTKRTVNRLHRLTIMWSHDVLESIPICCYASKK